MWRRVTIAACISAVNFSAASAHDAQTGLFRGHPVIYKMSHGQAIFQGDIVLDHVSPLPHAGARIRPPSVGIAYAQYLWPKNAQGVAEIPYTVTSGAADLNAALSAFNATFAGVIQFVPLVSQTDYVNFDFDPNNLSGQCESSVGRVGGPQVVGGSAACVLGTLLHEMGHVVGPVPRNVAPRPRQLRHPQFQ